MMTAVVLQKTSFGLKRATWTFCKITLFVCSIKKIKIKKEILKDVKVSRIYIFRYTSSIIKIITNCWLNKKKHLFHIYMSVSFHCFGVHLCHETYPLVQLTRGGLCDGKKVSDGCNKDLKKSRKLM